MAGLTERLLNEGRQEGRQEGEQNLLLRLLTRRFGPLDAATEQRVQQASLEELERWADNILDARTRDEALLATEGPFLSRSPSLRIYITLQRYTSGLGLCSILESPHSFGNRASVLPKLMPESQQTSPSHPNGAVQWMTTE